MFDSLPPVRLHHGRAAPPPPHGPARESPPSTDCASAHPGRSHRTGTPSRSPPATKCKRCCAAGSASAPIRTSCHRQRATASFGSPPRRTRSPGRRRATEETSRRPPAHAPPRADRSSGAGRRSTCRSTGWPAACHETRAVPAPQRRRRGRPRRGRRGDAVASRVAAGRRQGAGMGTWAVCQYPTQDWRKLIGNAPRWSQPWELCPCRPCRFVPRPC